MARSNTVEVIIRAKDRASKAFRKVRRNLKGLGRVARGFGTVMKGVGIAIGAAIVGFVHLARRGGQVQSIATVFENTAQRVGMSSRDLLAHLRAVTRGTVNNAELMAKANSAIGTGAITLQDFSTALEFTGLVAKATGQSVEFLTNKIITGLLRGSTMLLDDALPTLRREFEKLDTEGLSPAEKKAALLATAFRLMNERLVVLRKTSGDTNDEFKQFTTSLKNARDRLAKLVAQKPAVADLFNTLEGGVERLTRRMPELLDQLATFATKVAELTGIGDPASRLAGERFRDLRAQARDMSPAEQRAFFERELAAIPDRARALNQDVAEARALLRRKGFLNEQGELPPGVRDIELFGLPDDIGDIFSPVRLARMGDNIKASLRRALASGEIEQAIATVQGAPREFRAMTELSNQITSRLGQLERAARGAAAALDTVARGGAGAAGARGRLALRDLGVAAPDIQRDLITQPFLHTGLAPGIAAGVDRIREDLENSGGDINNAGQKVVRAFEGVAFSLQRLAAGGSAVGAASGIAGTLSTLFKAGSSMALGFGIAGIGLNLIDAFMSDEHEDTIARGVERGVKNAREDKALVVLDGAWSDILSNPEAEEQFARFLEDISERRVVIRRAS